LASLLAVPMLNFLFWNIAKKPLNDRVIRLAHQHDVDVLMLAESTLDVATVVTGLNALGSSPYSFQESDGDKIQFFSRPSVGAVTEQFVDGPGSITVRRLDLPGAVSILVAVLHLPSKLNWSNTTQTTHSVLVSQEIRAVEVDVGHARTIVVGDFNMNPFDSGLISTHGFNAVLTRREAKIRPRTVQGRQFPYFFNPMWSFLGDKTPHASGTYYHRSPPPDAQAWNIYDQVIVRPVLMDALRSVEILTSDGGAPLANAYGIPMHRQASDHLPILFKMSV
jgi:hypothetical protein